MSGSPFVPALAGPCLSRAAVLGGSQPAPLVGVQGAAGWARAAPAGAGPGSLHTRDGDYICSSIHCSAALPHTRTAKVH